MKPTRILIAVVTLLFGMPGLSNADIVLPAVGGTVTDDFNSYFGLGFSPVPAAGQLDSDTYRAVGFSDGPGTFGGFHDSGDFARGESAGGVTTGGAYAFEVATDDYAVGVQPTDEDFTPGFFTIRAANQTGQAISGVRIQADGYFFNDTNSSTRWTFELSSDDVDYTPLLALDSGLVAQTGPTWSAIPIDATINFPGALPDGSLFFIRIRGDDLIVAPSGNRDQFALDNLTLTAVPEPGIAGLTVLVTAAFVRRRRKKIDRHAF